MKRLRNVVVGGDEMEMRKNLLQLIRGNNSQAEMAEKYGSKQQTWYSWESGRTVPSGSVMLQMEHDFGLPMEVIFFDEFNYKNKLKMNEKTSA